MRGGEADGRAWDVTRAGVGPFMGAHSAGYIVFLEKPVLNGLESDLNVFPSLYVQPCIRESLNL